MPTHWTANPTPALQAIFDESGFERLIYFSQSEILLRRPVEPDWVNTPPFVCDRDKLRAAIETKAPGNPAHLCLDLESPMGHPFDSTSAACYADAMGVAADAKKRSAWRFYENIHRPLAWKNPGEPRDAWGGAVYALVHAIAPSLYLQSFEAAVAVRIQWDIERIWTLLAWLKSRWPGKAVHPFVSVRFKRDGVLIPIDYWRMLCLTVFPPGQCLWLGSDDAEGDVAWLAPYCEAMQ